LCLILVTYYYGDGAAQGFLHDTAGFALFGCALLLRRVVRCVVACRHAETATCIGVIFCCWRRQLGALGASEALRPRRKIDYLGKARLDEVIPAHIGYWRASGGNDIIAPSTPGSLSSRLYNQTVARSYIDEKDEARRIMFLAAYGREQNDALQLHRPKSCYPAVGFVIRSRTRAASPFGQAWRYLLSY